MTISGYCQLVNSADIYFRIIPAPLNHGGAVNAKSADADTTEFFSSPSSIFRECSFIATCTASIRIRNANVPLHFLRKFNLHGFVPPLRTMILRRRHFASSRLLISSSVNEQGHTQVSLFNSLADSHTAILDSRNW
jgi:hypothetical protein